MTNKAPSSVKVSPRWWKESVVYQLYPRSFKDSNGDGIGDLRGIIQKLDYLKDLGVDVVWLCPMFKSPQDDNGYDVSDYQDIHFEFGTMADFKDLMAEMRRRDMKLVLDLVLNHTSDEHPWFIESRSSKDNPKRDWYIWRDGKNGQEPNNWESIFAGSVWKHDALTNQYFMHIFSARQPDLNWENKDMRKALYDMINWWMDQGIDGFRIDAFTHTKKVAGFPDLPNPQGLKYVNSTPMHMNRPGVLEYLEDACRNSFGRRDIMTVAEANGVGFEEAAEWVGEDKKRLSMIIQFGHTKLWDSHGEDKFDLVELKEIFTGWQNKLHGVGWNALFVENHDIIRVTSKWGDTGRYWRESATSIAAMYFLMEGTPFIYQGQEIGMTNTVFNGPEDFQDVFVKNQFAIGLAEGRSKEELTRQIAPNSRDNARTPMQWNAETNAGFGTGTPWLKVNPNYKEINVELQSKDPQSVLSFYKNLIKIRRENKVFVYGVYELLLADHPDVYAYSRELDGQKAWVICNMKAREAKISLPNLDVGAQVLLANYNDQATKLQKEMTLKPYEALVVLSK